MSYRQRLDQIKLFDELCEDLARFRDSSIGKTDNDRLVASNMMIAIALRLIANAIEDH